LKTSTTNVPDDAGGGIMPLGQGYRVVKSATNFNQAMKFRCALPAQLSSQANA
jgi:hypothetical protein